MIELKPGRCCGNCKHSEYSTRSLSSWCNKHHGLDYCDTKVCEDFEI